MIAFLIALILPLVFAQRVCLNNGLMGPSGDKCYHFIPVLQNFDDAEVVCGRFESVLVSITTGFESNFVLDSAHQKLPGEYWIGLTDFDNENVWRWMDGRIANYTNWATGFPKNDSTRRCVATQWSGKWMNVNCSSYSAYFVCHSVPPTEEALTKCPPNAVEELSGCFTGNIVPETYKVAETICGEFGGKLAEVYNPQQSLELTLVAKETFYKSDYWIGVADPYDSGTWQFLDGTAVNFTNWAVGYPEIDGTSFCAAARLFDGKWYNTGCDNKNPSICQQKFANESNEWMYFRESDSFYKGYNQMRGTALEFEKVCTDQGSHLASVHSFGENLFVAASIMHAADENLVIGAQFNSTIGNFTWTDGTKWDYQYWDSKATAAKPCAFQIVLSGYYNALKWSGIECNTSVTYDFVCKKPRVSL